MPPSFSGSHGARPRRPASANRTEPAQPQERLGPPRRFRGPGDWQSPTPAGRSSCRAGNSRLTIHVVRAASLELADFRSIVSMKPIELGAVNVLIGPNNAGKSSLLRGLYTIQQGVGDLDPDIRLGAE